MWLNPLRRNAAILFPLVGLTLFAGATTAGAQDAAEGQDAEGQEAAPTLVAPPAPAPEPASAPIPPSAEDQPETPNEMWTDTLANGLRVAGRTQATSLSAVCISYRVGTEDDPDGYTGLAHLTEHLMFGSTRRMPDGFHGLLESAGATYINAFTTHDQTQYCVSLPDVSLERALFGEAERMAFLLQSLSEEQLETQQRVVANEALERGEGTTTRTLAHLHVEELHRGNATRLRGYRQESDVDAIRLENVQWFHQRYYGPANAALSIVSPRPRREVAALVQRYFGPIRGRAAPERSPAPPTDLAGSVDIDFESRVNNARLRIVWPTPAYLTDDDFALDFAARHLQRVLAAELYSSDVIGVSARQFSDYEGSHFRIEIHVRRYINLDVVLRHVDRNIRALANVELSDEEMNIARGRMGQQGDSPRDWSATMARNLLFEGRIWTRRERRARHSNVSAAQVRDAVRSWLRLDRRIIVRATHDVRAEFGGTISIRRRP